MLISPEASKLAEVLSSAARWLTFSKSLAPMPSWATTAHCRLSSIEVWCVVTLTMGKRFTGTDASASLKDLDVAGGDLAFVGGEGGQDFGLLTLRDLEEIQGPSELRCDLIKFCWGDP